MNRKQLSEINERTRVPLGVAVGAGVFVCMLVLWAGRIEWLGTATAKNTEGLGKDLVTYRTEVDLYKGDVQAMKSDIKVIKCHLQIPDPACPRIGRPGQ